MSVIDAIIAKKLCGGGGGSVPKPLTYDYMPDGYPTKTVQTTTLMEEQEVAFSTKGDGIYVAALIDALDVVGGQTYTVNWDGTEYKCVCNDNGGYIILGNLSIMGEGVDTGEPFLFLPTEQNVVVTLDTSATHTISVKTTAETVTPMAAEFLPSEVDELIMNSSTTGSTKKFKITVDDNGTISATEVT